MDEIFMDEVSIFGIFWNFEYSYLIHKDFDL